MSFVYELVVVAHLIGMAAIVGSYFMVMKAPRLVPGMVHGALLQVVTGMILVGMRESGAVSGEDPLNHAKVGLKLLIALIVLGLGWAGRGKENVSPTIVHAIGGLAILNVCIAALWS